MSFQKTRTITYTGSELSAVDMSAHELLVAYKDAAGINESISQGYLSANGFVDFTVEKMNHTSVRYVEIWESAAAFEAWHNTHTSGDAADWTVA